MTTRRTITTLLAVGVFLYLAGTANATVVGVTNGDFETDPLADGGTRQNVTSWFESSLAGNYNDWLYRSSASFLNSTNLFGMSNTNGYLYQQIGTYTPGETVTIAGQALNRNVGVFRGFTVSIYSGNVAAADGSSLTGLGATLLDSQSYTNAHLDMFSNPDSSPFSAVLNSGVTGTAGDPLWLELTPGTGANETFLDDITAAGSGGGGLQPRSIGVNFSTGSSENVSPGQQPGVAAGGNWTNVGVTTGVTTSNLQDDSGAATTADVTLNTGLNYNFGNGTTGNGGFNIMVNRGVFGAGNGGANDEVSVTFDEIPYDEYDVYVFAQSRTTNGTDLSVTIGGTTFYYDTDGSSAADEIKRILSTTPGSPTPGGSYALFEALTGDSFTLTTDGSITGAISNQVFGVHIVDRTAQGDIPEPATMGMLTIAFAGLGGYVRRRRRLA